MIRSGDSDDYCVLLESDKTFNNEHGGRQRSGSNGMVLIDISQPYHSNHPDGLDVLDVFVPREALRRALGPVRSAVGLAIEPDQASHAIISTFLRSLHTHGATLDSARAERMASVAVELIAAGFAEKITQAPDSPMSAAAMLCRAQAYIAARIDSPGLAMKDVAAGLGISVRQLHQIAAEDGLSLVDWMWERRLVRARNMLAEPANAHLAIGWIAARCGFVDPAHFARRFKDRFGQSARDFRDRSAFETLS